MASPRFQFTIRELLWAMFWAAMSMTLGVFYFRGTRQLRPDSLWLLSLPAFLVSAVLAITAIFGRGRLAFWVIVMVGVLTIGTLLILRNIH